MKHIYAILSLLLVSISGWGIAPIVGNTYVCQGYNATYTDSTPGGFWSSASISIGSTTGIVYGMHSGTNTITYTVGSSYVTKDIITAHIIDASSSFGSFGGGHCVGYGFSQRFENIASVPPSMIMQLMRNGVLYGPQFTGWLSPPISDPGLYIPSGIDTITGCPLYYRGPAWELVSQPAPFVASSLCAGSSSSLTDSLPGGVWTCSNTSVATIGSSDGIISGVNVGTTIITYSMNRGIPFEPCATFDTIRVTSTCTGTPLGGTASLSSGIIGCGEPDTLIVTGYTNTCGNSLQWQSSADGITWQDIPSANRAHNLIHPLDSRQYRCRVTCVTSGLFSYSTPISIVVWNRIGNHNVDAVPDTGCHGANFYISACHTTSGLSVKTIFGDGSSDSHPLSDTGISFVRFNHIYVYSGAYTVKQVLFAGAIAQDSVTFTYQSKNCHIIPLKFYYDINNNCTRDSGENDLNFIKLIAVDSNGIIIDTISAVSGIYYKVFGPVGTVYGFRMIAYPGQMLISCPATGVVYDTIKAITSSIPLLNIGYNPGPISSIYNLDVKTIAKTGRHMMDVTMIVTNPYFSPKSATLSMVCSPKYAFSWAVPSPSSISGNVLTWNLDSVSCLKPYNITLHSDVLNSYDSVRHNWNYSVFLRPGDTINSFISVTPIIGDLDTSNNVVIGNDTVKSSYDPNEISVLPATDVLPCTPLEYTIKFENTGNAPAENIYVLDTLPAGLDMHSIELKSSSALMNIEYVNDAGYNVIKFDFPGIQLKDSSHHGECDGFMIFSIKTLSGVTTGTQLLNRAGIYFDDNEVVLTNSVTTGIGINPIAGSPIVCMTLKDTLANATPGGVWSISGPNATINKGVVSGIRVGTADVTYTVSNACASLSTSKSLTIYPKLVPSVSINSIYGDTVCIDKDFSASTSIINGGTSPKYKWQVNSNGSDTGSTYTYHPNNNDVVSVLLTSNAICAIPATAIATQVVNTLAPSITVSAANNNKIGIGESDTLIAQLENAGKNPTYQWLINNQPEVGETHQILVTNKLVNGDQVSCQVICSDICGGTTIQGSLSVEVLPFHEGDVVLSPNPNKGVFTLEGLFETNITKVAVDIKDVLGRSAFSATIPTTNGYFKQMITLAHLSKGMYMLTINTGGVNMVKKFVVE